MQQSPHGWTIIDKAAGILTRSYEFAANGTANTFVARMADGKLLVLSPACKLTDDEFGDLAQFGDVGAVVATNGFHHLGVASWRQQFPEARFFAPAAAHARIAQKNKDAGEFEPLDALQPLLGADVHVIDAPATKCGELWAWAKGSNGAVWFTSDIIANMPLPPKFPVKQLFKWTNSAPGYKIFNLAIKFIIKDKKAVLTSMLADLKANPPVVVVPAHGEILEQESIAADTFALVEGAL